MAATAHSLEHHLEVLPAMLNLVLIQTGKILRDEDLQNPQNASLTRRRIGEFVPPANEEFHSALDEIEAQILQAKAVMERDLSKIRIKRAERERQPSRSAITSPTKLQETSGEEAKVTLATTQSPAVEIQQAGDQDTVIPDAPIQPNGNMSEAAQKRDNVEAEAKNEAIISLEGMPQGSQNAAGLAISLSGDENAAAKTDELLAELPQPLGESKDGDGLDFDSIFNDAEMIPQDGTLDFDMDFSLEGNGTQNILGDTSMEGINFGTSELVNAVPASNEDLNSLLPGLENYVNATNESHTSAPPGTNATSLDNVPMPADGNNASTSVPPAAESALADTSLEELFDAADFDANQANSNGGELQIGDGHFEGFEEFNDDWFKM